MSSLWRRRRSGRRSLAGKRDDEEGINSGTKLSIPTHFRCPISLDLMKDPVSLATGITYDRDCIEKWLDAGNVTCPVTKQVLRNFDQIPNHALRKMIQCWCVENKSNGVERIPTPRIPITPYEVTGVCSRMAAATSRGDGDECQELVKKVKKWAKESERNQKCLVSNGIGAVLAEMFKHFSVDQKSWSLLREIICALTWSFPLSKEAISKLTSSCCMIASFLNEEEDVSTRRNAIFVLKELSISDDQGFVADTLVQEGKGIEDALLRMMKEPPICPKTTQASLVVIHHMILSTHPTISSRFIKMGLLSLILDIIVDGNKSMCEKGLCLLDEICNLEEGKGSACGNALTVPILVKKILRVSNATTDFCVSILWKMCLGLGGNEETPIRALQFGGFQKVLVVLQVGCGEGTKEKATELLRFMNAYRDKVECFDSSMGFKYLQRSI